MHASTGCAFDMDVHVTQARVHSRESRPPQHTCWDSSARVHQDQVRRTCSSSTPFRIHTDVEERARSCNGCKMLDTVVGAALEYDGSGVGLVY